MAEKETTETENDKLVDEYELVSMIADGTSTQIWEVKEQGGSNTFAMKRMLPEAMKKPEVVATMKLEAKVGAAVDHPNLIQLHKFIKNKKNCYLVMDYFRAPNLRSQISSDRRGVQNRLRKLIESAAMALGHMHEKGWVHKDIKPENILISKSSEVKIVDFGLAVPVAKGIGKLFGKAKSVQGTRSYIAPETIKKQALGPGADIYSLGITIFEILTGKTPFHGENPKEVLLKHISERPVPPSSINPNVTPEMDEFVLKMLAKKPENRFLSMEEVVSSIRNLKIFKQEIAELIEQEKAEAEQAEKDSMQEKRLDSRADAKLSQLMKDDPELAKQLIAQRNANKKSKPKPEPPPQKKPQQQQQPPQPMPGGYPPQYQQPMYPPQPMPGQPMPYPPQYQGQPMPPGGYPPPGYPQQPYPPQQQPYPQQPQQPGQQPPGPPQQQQPPQQPPQPPAQQQPAPAGQQPPPPAQKPPQAAPPQQQPPESQQPAAKKEVEKEQKSQNDDDLPFMEELPDVI